MATVIQINSLEALERLIGGDSETEISIRNSVVQEFSKRHLKNVLTPELEYRLKESIKEELLKEYFTPNSVKYKTYIFQDDVRGRIKEQLMGLVYSFVREIISEVLEENLTKEVITDKLNAAVETLEKSLLPEEIEKRFKFLVDKKVKETFGV